MDKFSQRVLKLLGASASGAGALKLLRGTPRLKSMPPEEIAQWLSTEEGAAALAWISGPGKRSAPKLRKFADVIPAQPGARHLPDKQ